MVSFWVTYSLLGSVIKLLPFSVMCSVWRFTAFSTQCHRSQNRTGKIQIRKLGKNKQEAINVFWKITLLRIHSVSWFGDLGFYFSISRITGLNRCCVFRAKLDQPGLCWVSAELNSFAPPPSLGTCDSIVLAFLPPFLHFFVGSIASNIRIPSSLILRSSSLFP